MIEGRHVAEGTVLRYTAEYWRDGARQTDNLVLCRIIQLDGRARRQTLGPAGWTTHEPGQEITAEQLLVFEPHESVDDFLRPLAELAWLRNWRPVERQDTTGRLEDHLADMRRIAFAATGIDEPGRD